MSQMKEDCQRPKSLYFSEQERKKYENQTFVYNNNGNYIFSKLKNERSIHFGDFHVFFFFFPFSPSMVPQSCVMGNFDVHACVYKRICSIEMPL